VTALLSVILNVIGFDIMTEINCEVSFVTHVLLVILSDQQYFQGLGHLFSRERLLLCAQVATPNTSFYFFLGLFFHRLYFRHAVDRASCVGLPCVTIILQKQDAEIILAESSFGTRRRLLLQSQWPYGWQTTQFSSSVSTSYRSQENLLYTW
jgi:hypothetical protein